jgi:mono/diheme cytochrome c family protein
VKRWLLALFLVPLLHLPAALACPIVTYRTVTNYQAAYVAPTYTAPTYAVQIVPQYTTILTYGLLTPAYGASWVSPPAYPAQPAGAAVNPAVSPCDAKIAALQAQIDALMKKLEPPPPPPQKIMGRASDGEVLGASAYFQARCASCHEAAVASSKGKGMILHRNDGGPVRLSRENVQAILAQVESGKMPIDGPRASSAQMFALRTELSSLVFNSP